MKWGSWIATFALVIACCGVTTARAGSLQVSPIGPVEPSATGAEIDKETSASNYNYVYVPTKSTERKNVLVLFLGGSDTSPFLYTDVAKDAATDGYGVLDLRYNNALVLGAYCPTISNADQCYTQMRGQIIFGNGVQYNSSLSAYQWDSNTVTSANSIVNRVVNLINWLAMNDTVAGSSYWSQFLIADPNSPYSTKDFGSVYPDWSKIVVAGHSQGGGHAAFIGMQLPVRRVVMLSSPQDNIKSSSGANVSASWITAVSATSMTKYWGARNENEGAYGDFVVTNWQKLGATGVSTPDTSADVSASNINIPSPTIDVGNGSDIILANGTQHLVVLNSPDLGSLINHSSTAVNFVTSKNIVKVWDYLFTANSTD